MNDLDKNTGEWAKVPQAPYILIKRREVTPSKTRLSHLLTVSPSLSLISPVAESVPVTEILQDNNLARLYSEWYH